MKKILLFLLFVMAGNAEDFYAKISGGANFLQNSVHRSRYQTGYVISGSLGYSLPCNLYLEGEYAYRENDIRRIHFLGQGFSKHGHFQASSFMANLLWDVPLCWAETGFWDIRSYVGGGIGYDSQKMHSSNSLVIFNQRWDHFSWQVMGGFAYPIFCNTDLTLEYKFHQGGARFNNHSIGIGLVYYFGFR